MKLVKKLLNKLDGLHYPQEYLCLSRESFQQPLQLYLVEGRRITENITHKHLFTGYCPLIFTLSTSPGDKRHLPDEIDIFFSQHSRQPNELLEKKDAIAFLSLKMIRRQSIRDIEIVYYEGIKGKHHFLSSFHQYMISLGNQLYNKKTGNVFLHDNLYKQVQIAYAAPRVISLITVSDGSLFNLFPTDLHGPVNDQYYVSSLRHNGNACKQVLAAGRIIISEMHSANYKLIYSLGKNHMQELKAKDILPFSHHNSLTFQLPLPQSVLYYRELEVLESFEHGIHTLFLYKIVSGQAVRGDPATLAHIHNVYATWRHNKGLAGNYLLR